MSTLIKKCEREPIYLPEGRMTRAIPEKMHKYVEMMLANYYPNSLKKFIRRKFEYRPEDLEKMRKAKKSLVREFMRLEWTFEKIDKCYPEDMLRDGQKHVEKSHALRTMSTLAEIGEGPPATSAGGLHDMPEDFLEGKITYWIKAGSVWRKARTEQEVYDDIEQNTSKWVSDEVKRMTRGNEKYSHYLVEANKHRPTATDKQVDTFVKISEPEGKDLIKILWKTGMQVKRAAKTSWLMSELLLYGIEKYAKDVGLEKMVDYLKTVTMYDLRKLFKGYTWCEPRGYNTRVINQQAKSGSPVVNIYWEERAFLVELPFITDEETAKRIVRDSVLDNDYTLQSIGIMESMMPEQLSERKTIVRAEVENIGNMKQGERLSEEMARLYDKELTKGILPDFDRKQKVAEILGGKYSPVKLDPKNFRKEFLPYLPRESDVYPELKEQKGHLDGSLKSIHQETDKFVRTKSDQEKIVPGS